MTTLMYLYQSELKDYTEMDYRMFILDTIDFKLQQLDID